MGQGLIVLLILIMHLGSVVVLAHHRLRQEADAARPWPVALAEPLVAAALVGVVVLMAEQSFEDARALRAEILENTRFARQLALEFPDGPKPLTGINLAGAQLDRLNLSRASLAGADLTEASLVAADLSASDLTGANMTGSNLGPSDPNLELLILFGMEAIPHDVTGRTNLTRANLTRAKLTGIVLSVGELSEVDLTGADLIDANLHGARLANAILAGTNLTGAGLARASLTRADLSGAILTNTIFDYADLTDVDFTNVCWDEAHPPTWPWGFDAPAPTRLVRAQGGQEVCYAR